MLEEILLLDESRDGDRPKAYHLSLLVVVIESCVGDLYLMYTASCRTGT